MDILEPTKSGGCSVTAKDDLLSATTPLGQRLFVRPHLLLHPQIPKPLHGVNPRTVLGQEWWDRERRAAYAKNNFHCWACGIHKNEAKFHHWLEGHEHYHIDYLAGRMTYIECVALCHACHNFIHFGRLRQLCNTGEITKDKFLTISAHGQALIRGLRPNREYNDTKIPWHTWRLCVDGMFFGPSTQSFNEWQAGLWRSYQG